MNFGARGCMYCEGECNKECLKEAVNNLKGKELFKESNDRARKLLSEVKSLPIVETLEEAAKEFVLSHDFSKLFSPTNPNHLANRCFQYGAKWQAERMYSEEDMIAFAKYCNLKDDLSVRELLTIWFDQFKKK